MYFAAVNQQGETLLHKNVRTRPDNFFVVALYREDLVVEVECMFVPMYHRQAVLAGRPPPARRYCPGPRPVNRGRTNDARDPLHPGGASDGAAFVVYLPEKAAPIARS